MGAILQDLRFGLRLLRRDAALTTFAILIVGLGVGASSTVFSLFNALFLRPLPLEDPAHLVWIANGESANLSAHTVQVDNLLDFRSMSHAFSGVAGFSAFYGSGDIRFSGAGEPERLTGVPVTEGFFPLLGVEPLVGRFFSADECRWNAPKTVVLSHGFWQRHFGGDPGVVGRSIVLDDRPATVVGVLPPSFDFAAIFTPGRHADLFLPFPLSPETNRQGNMLALIGRLEPGVDLEAAQAEATLIGERLRNERSAGETRRRNRFRPRLSLLRDHVSGRFRYALLVLAGAVGFLMLLVCANLSNLLLSRASARQKEMAIRAALGAGRRRLLRQTLIESLTLSCSGAVLGLALATGGTRVMAHLGGTGIPLLRDVRVDATALGFTLLLAVLAGLVFGLTPALQMSAFAPYSALKDGTRGSTGDGGPGWMRGSLVVCEIALACVLLTGTGLLVRSLIGVLDVDLGFKTHNLLALRVDPGRAYSTLAQKTSDFDEILRAARSVPGVEAAGLTDALPLGDNFGWRTWSVEAQGQVYERGHEPYAFVRVVGDGYLETMGISLRRGRTFTPADNASAEQVAVINETLARALWPGEDPIGRTLLTSGRRREWRVIGVVRGVRYFGPEQGAGAELYLPIRQDADYSSVDLVLRASRSPASLVPALRAAIKAVDPRLPTTGFRTVRQLVDRSVFPRRAVVLLLAGFAGFGLVLATLGIYGVISYSVTQRTREIGIRMALGASAGDVQARFLKHTGTLALVGITLGASASWATARALQGLLFGVSFSDPATFAAVLAVLAAVATLAGYLPARRASRLNPLTALRFE